MTRLSRPAGATDTGALAATGAGGGGGASDAGTGVAAWPSRPGAELARGRRRRRRRAAPVFSAGPDVAVTESLGAASTGGGAEAAAGPAAGRRPRRRRDAGAGLGAGAAGVPSVVQARAACALRRTLAPTSPSAHSAPSAVWMSTRQTTMAVGAPPTGGRFWVSVQRA